MWFKQLTGFDEISPENFRANLEIQEDAFISKANSQKFTFGKLDIPTLEQLRNTSHNVNAFDGQIQVSEIIADAGFLHRQPENANAMFQVASQFNLLEMISPDVTPESGIDRYSHDRTQGPACAIACGAGTIFRNYFVEVNGQIGQTENNQIDCLDLIGKELGNENQQLWTMQNGYMLTDDSGLMAINEKLDELNEAAREKLKGKLKTGIQWNTEVTTAETGHNVSQIFCSALPVAYNAAPTNLWEPFARLILEATYESSLYAGLRNMENNNSNIVFLTMVGGGAFGNEEDWIIGSMFKAFEKFKKVPLDIRIVSYRNSNPNIQKALAEM